MQKKINILIPNATSPKNIGDLAILTALYTLIKNQYTEDAEVIVHTTEASLYQELKAIDATFKPTLYDWAILSHNNFLLRCLRLSQLLFQYFLLKLGIKFFFISSELRDLINDYLSADLIVFVGGGYFRSQTGITQSLNLFMQILLFKFSEFSSAVKIVAPISIGPFAYKWQEDMVVNHLKSFKHLMVREKYSAQILQKHGVVHHKIAPDNALLLSPDYFQQSNSRLLGFTIRNWLQYDEQINFEKEVANAITKFALKNNLVVQPIIQVDVSAYPIEDDRKATQRVISLMDSNNLKILPIKKITNLNNAAKTYSELALLIGMRMHSTILAAISNVPSISLAYEHKSTGTAEILETTKYCLELDKVTEKLLYERLTELYDNKSGVKKTLREKIKKITDAEYAAWNKYFRMVNVASTTA